MKGFIEKVLMLIWILVPVLLIVTVHSKNLVSLVEGTAQIEARFSAIEIASAISVLQSGPDGVQHKYDLPAITMPGCVKIYQTYVETRLGQAATRIGDSEILEHAAFSADIHDIPDGRPISVDCNATSRQLVLRKEAGKVRISTA